MVLVEGVRTPFLVAGTEYKTVFPHQLGVQSIQELLRRIDIPKELVDYVVFGQVAQDARTSNVGREAMLAAGLNERTPAHTVTMACISSNQAIATCVNQIWTGQSEICIAGGVDMTSDVPIRYNRRARQAMIALNKAKSTSQRLSLGLTVASEVFKPEIPAIAEYSSNEVMGHSADRLAAAFQVSRKEQDEYGLRSHACAAEATRKKWLIDLFPFKVPALQKPVTVDNGVRPSTPEAVAKLKPAFIKPYGTITAATSSFLTDGGSACLLASEEKALQLGLKPKAIIRDYVFVAQDPKDQLLLGPAYAIRKLLERNKLTAKDIGAYEIHEAFAGVVLACAKALESEWFARNQMGATSTFGAPPLERVNTWGGSLSIGHPFGATGVRLLTTAANRLLSKEPTAHSPNSDLAVVAACAAGGLGHAMLVERYGARS